MSYSDFMKRLSSFQFIIWNMIGILVWFFRGEKKRQEGVWKRLYTSHLKESLLFDWGNQTVFHEIEKARWNVPWGFPQVILPVSVTSNSPHPFSTPFVSLSHS